MSDAGFDIDSAWFRRFSADAVANLGAFALRLKEALPDLVAVERRRGLFGKRGEVTAVDVALGDRRYRLSRAGGRLQATGATVVRNVTLNTRPLDPAEWFAQLAAETRAASGHAEALSRSLQGFMRS